eukprot:SAG31_NODE_1719_length_7455_cov_7.529772_9_plen_46_part_00
MVCWVVGLLVFVNWTALEDPADAVTVGQRRRRTADSWHWQLLLML